MMESWDPSKISEQGGQIKDGDKIGISFDLGNIEDEKYGKATKLSGVIPLLWAHGEFPVPKILYDETRFNQIVQNFKLEWNSLWEKESGNEIEETLRDYVIFALMGDPGGWDDMDHPRMKLRLMGIVGGYLADDIADNLDESEEMTYKNLAIFFENNIEENLPTFLAKFAPLLKKFIHGLHANIQNFEKRGKTFYDVMAKFLQAFMLVRGCNKNQHLSEDALMDMNGWISTFIQIQEFTFLFAWGVDLPKYIRKDVLFIRFQQSIGNCSALMNAVFGLGRDVRTNQVNDSPILRQVVYRGITLQEAFDNVYQKLLGNMNDLRNGSQLLLGRYSNVAALEIYINCAKYIIDGQFYTYMHVKRYGSTNLKIQKISEENGA